MSVLPKEKYMPAYRVTREQVIDAVSRGKDWLLQNQITPATTSYDTFVETAPKQGYWTDAPIAKHLIERQVVNR